MNKNILYIHNEPYYNLPEINILKTKYNVNECNNYKDFFYLEKKYQYIIIDLEINNHSGDIICKKIKENYKIPIIGVYANVNTVKKKKYNTIYFNDLVTLPVLDWFNIINNIKPVYLADKSKWVNWLKKEYELCNYYHKIVFNNKYKKIPKIK